MRSVHGGTPQRLAPTLALALLAFVLPSAASAAAGPAATGEGGARPVTTPASMLLHGVHSSTTPAGAIPRATAPAGTTPSTRAVGPTVASTTPAGAAPPSTVPNSAAATPPAGSVTPPTARTTPLAPLGTAATRPATRRQTATRLSTGAIVAAVLAALLILVCLVWGAARWWAYEPRWTVSLRHSLAEAGWRLSASWDEFSEWTKLGR
jgi:hypothetical protein